MSQKKKKLEKQKLKDQARILYTSSMTVGDDADKLNLILRSAMIIKRVRCPERAKYFKEAIALAEKLQLWKSAYKMAALALRKNDERAYFLGILEKYRGQADEKS
ncbi:hypothetical protein KAR91_56170 [Candidatus Pacearchaeota archaeon]|nr:hypothetical protein [Candidatus Pacearchaeota archaeon]